jgi:hypothetical protein
MFDPIPESGESANDRFKRFAKAILAVPKAEVPTAEEAIARLKVKRQKFDGPLEKCSRRWQSARKRAVARWPTSLQHQPI